MNAYLAAKKPDEVNLFPPDMNKNMFFNFLSKKLNHKYSQLLFRSISFHSCYDSQVVKFLLDTRERLNTKKTSTSDSVTDETNLDPIQVTWFPSNGLLTYQSGHDNTFQYSS